MKFGIKCYKPEPAAFCSDTNRFISDVEVVDLLSVSRVLCSKCRRLLFFCHSNFTVAAPINPTR